MCTLPSDRFAIYFLFAYTYCTRSFPTLSNVSFHFSVRLSGSASRCASLLCEFCGSSTRAARYVVLGRLCTRNGPRCLFGARYSVNRLVFVSLFISVQKLRALAMPLAFLKMSLSYLRLEQCHGTRKNRCSHEFFFPLQLFRKMKIVEPISFDR